MRLKPQRRSTEFTIVTQMIDALELAIFLNPGLQIVFLAVSIFYAVSIARRVGTFWAWSLIVAAFALDGVRNLISLILLFVLTQEQLSALVQQLGPTRIWQSLIVGSVSVFCLALGMYGLSKTFEKLQMGKSGRK